MCQVDGGDTFFIFFVVAFHLDQTSRRHRVKGVSTHLTQPSD